MKYLATLYLFTVVLPVVECILDFLRAIVLHILHQFVREHHPPLPVGHSAYWGMHQIVVIVGEWMLIVFLIFQRDITF